MQTIDIISSSNTVNKMSPRPSLIPDTENSVQSEPTTSTQQSSRAAETPKPIGRSGSCRICLKAFKPNEFSKTCVECDQKVCEDCASYSKLDECEFMVGFHRIQMKVMNKFFFLLGNMALQRLS